jgi:hypothetical protein
MNKYEQIKLVEESDFVLNDIYLGYSEFWDKVNEIDLDPEKLTLYEKDIDILYDALVDYIKFRSNYKNTLKELIK